MERIVERPFWSPEASAEVYRVSVMRGDDTWVAACGGKETPTWSPDQRAWFLYVYNPRRAEHAWLNMGTDMIEATSPFRLEVRPGEVML